MPPFRKAFEKAMGDERPRLPAAVRVVIGQDATERFDASLPVPFSFAQCQRTRCCLLHALLRILFRGPPKKERRGRRQCARQYQVEHSARAARSRWRWRWIVVATHKELLCLDPKVNPCRLPVGGNWFHSQDMNVCSAIGGLTRCTWAISGDEKINGCPGFEVGGCEQCVGSALDDHEFELGISIWHSENVEEKAILWIEGVGSRQVFRSEER